MKLGKTFIRLGTASVAAICAWLILSAPQKPAHSPSPGEVGTGAEALPANHQDAALPVDNERGIQASKVPQSLYPGWINNDGRFTSQTEQLLGWVESGHPLDMQIPGLPLQRLAFREIRLTTEDFQISTGKESVMPSEYRIYSGNLMGSDGPGENASLAIVNGAVSLTLSHQGTDFLVETDPQTGDLYAVALHSFDNGHACGSACGDQHSVCTLSDDGRIAAITAPTGTGLQPPERMPVRVLYPEDRLDMLTRFEPAGEGTTETVTAGKPYMRNGPEYDASLKDILVLMVSSKDQTGDSSGLSAKAASYFAITARSAEIYERQLGLRYMLQELVLIPSDSSEEDPGTDSATLGDDLYRLQSWANSYRPQSAYKWGHVALWTEVAGAPGGTIGLAWVDSYGSSSYGYSTQEANWGWSVHIHELGHNVGASHSSGGVMNASLINNTENFFTTSVNGSYTAAKDIYNYMVNRSYVFGPALLRNPVEMPFGVDDSGATEASVPVILDVLANDLTSVPYGATNTLQLVEIGQVYPKSAGIARIVNGQLEFTPADGFTGIAWMAYTLRGDIGNNGAGWLHRADAMVVVGGNNTVPTNAPALSLSNDFYNGELSGPVRINPLLNDAGTGHLWSGDVEVVLAPTDTTPETYSYNSLWLTGATLLSGTGTLSLETHNMTRGSSGGNPVYTGYLTYTPGSSDSGQVIIEYTAMDAFGTTGTAQIVLAALDSIGLSSDYSTVSEDSGDVITFTVSRPASADTALDELVAFNLGGTATVTGADSDFALAGLHSLDPLAGTGTVMIPAGEFTATILMSIEDDGIPEVEESVVLTITSCSSLPVSSANASATVTIQDNSVLFSESFDSFTTDTSTWNGWINLKNRNPSGKGGEDDFDWSVTAGTTPTTNTGPSSDHTTGSGNYFYAESDGNLNRYALLESPVINVAQATQASMEFWYHMLGTNMGTLTVELFADGQLATANLFSVSGQQSANGADWQKASIDLTPYLPAQSITLRFRAEIGSGNLSDIAIDDISVKGIANTLLQGPGILADPENHSLESGQFLYLSVIPEGFPVPRVQWYKDGAPVQGANRAAFFISSVDETCGGLYEASVTNSEGTVMSASAFVNLPPSANVNYNAWAQGMVNSGIWNPSDWASTGDPDGDGIINSLEYAFNLNPMAASNRELPAARKTVDSASGDTYLEISYKRKKNDSDIQYVVETSANLDANGWVSGPGVVEEISVEPDETGEYETVTVRRLTPLGNGPGFMRIDVELTPPSS